MYSNKRLRVALFDDSELISSTEQDVTCTVKECLQVAFFQPIINNAAFFV